MLLHHLVEMVGVLKLDLHAQAPSLPWSKTGNMQINCRFTISMKWLECSIRDCSFNLHLSLCSLWSSCSYPETIPFKELLIQSVRSSSCSLWSSRSYPETIHLKELLIQSARLLSCSLCSSRFYPETILLKELFVQSARLSFVLIYIYIFFLIP